MNTPAWLRLACFFLVLYSGVGSLSLAGEVQAFSAEVPAQPQSPAALPSQLDSALPSFGFTFGTPAVWNFVVGYGLGPFGLRASGADYNAMKGWQGEFLIRGKNNPNYQVNFELLGGTYHWEGTYSDGAPFTVDRKYWGLGVDFSSHGLYVEGNLNSLLLNGRNLEDLSWADVLLFVQPGFQMGYLYQF